MDNPDGRALVNKNVQLAVDYHAKMLLSKLDQLVNTTEVGRDELMNMFAVTLSEVAIVSFEEGTKESKCDNPKVSSEKL